MKIYDFCGWPGNRCTPAINRALFNAFVLVPNITERRAKLPRFEHVLLKFDTDKVAELPNLVLGLRNEIFVAQQQVVGKVAKLVVQSCCQAGLNVDVGKLFESACSFLPVGPQSVSDTCLLVTHTPLSDFESYE